MYSACPALPNTVSTSGIFLSCRSWICENLRRLGDRHAGHGGRHVEHRALIQRRHEFVAEPLERKIVTAITTAAATSVTSAIAQHEIDERLVGPNQEPVDRILCFRRDLVRG